MYLTVNELGLSTRARNALVRNNVFDTDDLKKLSFYKLAKMRKLGRKSLIEIIDACKKIGIDIPFD